MDADLISQAVLALALNAREAAGESGRVRVEATAQRIAEAHGGSLRLEGHGLGPEGRGARFVLEVPA